LNYTSLEELIGDFLQEPGSKPGGDWTRYSQSVRQQGIAWAENIAADKLPLSDLMRLRTERKEIVATADGTEFIITSKNLGKFVKRIIDLYAYFTTSTEHIHFKDIGNRINLRHNINLTYGYHYYSDNDGQIRLILPSASTYNPTTGGDEPGLVFIKYPPSYDFGDILYHGSVTGDPFQVGETITGTDSSATATVTVVGGDYLEVSGISGTFQKGEKITGGSSSAYANLTYVSAEFGTAECPFEGNEELIAKGAASFIFGEDSDPRGLSLGNEFLGWLGINSEGN